MKEPSQKKQEIQILKPENKYKCKKCARRYKKKSHLTYHRKYECEVTPQFTCNFCGKLFKRKTHVNAHVGAVHRKSNSETSESKVNCNYCTRSYSCLRNLNRHKREKHAAVTPIFICDYCGHETNRKCKLGIHIYGWHLE